MLLEPARHEISQKNIYVMFTGEIQVGGDAENDLCLQYNTTELPPRLFKLTYRQPFWSLHLHPRLENVELNGVPVKETITLLAGDALTIHGIPLLFA